MHAELADEIISGLFDNRVRGGRQLFDLKRVASKIVGLHATFHAGPASDALVNVYQQCFGFSAHSGSLLP
jgi:hypothetical protein